jgi:hypothetical protein
MNLEIFKNPDPSGSLYKEKILVKKHPDEYHYIINYCIGKNIQDVPFKEKVYLCINSYNDVPKCKNVKCVNKVKYKNSTIGYYEYCCNKCINSDDNIKKIKEEKSLSKYGTKTPAESAEIKQKIINTNIKKYGYNSPIQNSEIKQKSLNTLMKNYSVDNPSKNEDIVQRRIESFKKSNYRKSYVNTCLEKYGTNYPLLSEEKKLIKSNKQKFTKNNKAFNLINERLYDNNYEIINININTKENDTLFCKRCNKNFLIKREFLFDRIENKSELCINCNPFGLHISGAEVLLKNFIREIYKEYIIENSRKIISPYEIDIFLPNLKIGFEYNGLYWHSELYKKNNYHLNKFELSEKNGITIISIWEDDWIYKNNIIKYQISTLFLSKKLKNYKIKEISESDAFNFLLLNSLYINPIINGESYGLYIDDEIISIIVIDDNSYIKYISNKVDSFYETYNTLISYFNIKGIYCDSQSIDYFKLKTIGFIKTNLLSENLFYFNSKDKIRTINKDEIKIYCSNNIILKK